MKRIKRSSELLWLFGIVFVALGVSLCSKADLGVSMIAAPPFVIAEAISKLWSFFSVGVAEYMIQGIIIVILCLVVGRFDPKYLLAFAVAVLYGYTLNFFLWIMGDLVISSVLMRWLMLLLGDLCVAFGVACFFRTYMPLQVYELFVSEVAKRFKVSVNKVKFAFDISLLALSITLALTLFGDFRSFDWSKIASTSFHSIGLGTLVTTAINSPLITLMGKIVDKIFEPTSRFKKLERILSQKHR